MLLGDTIKLRPASIDDVEYLYRLRNDEGTQKHLLSRPRPNTSEKVEDWYSKKTNDSDSVFFVVCDLNEANLFGYIQITGMDLISGYGYLGICLDSSSRGIGIGAEAIKLIEEYVKKVFDLRKIILEVLVYNESAIKLYRKIGYQEVGVYQRHYYYANEHHDVMVMEKFI